jgi:hypothetical protein
MTQRAAVFVAIFILAYLDAFLILEIFGIGKWCVLTLSSIYIITLVILDLLVFLPLGMSSIQNGLWLLASEPEHLSLLCNLDSAWKYIRQGGLPHKKTVYVNMIYLLSIFLLPLFLINYEIIRVLVLIKERLGK